jgi:hypothetical protein
VTVSLIILAALGVGLLMVGYGARLHAIQIKTEAVAMLAAEAGYEKAIFWMGQQKDMLSALQQGVEGTTGTIDFESGSCDYQIEFRTFTGSRPVYSIVSNGRSGRFNRTVNVLVIQAISGWDMGMCRVLAGGKKTMEVYFANGEIIDLPLHINNLNDRPDQSDIHISGSPQFLQSVAMGESRYVNGSGSDKYASVMDLFEAGIYFDQPNCKVTDEESINDKIARFAESTKSEFRFTPKAEAPVSSKHAAVQLEFFVENDVGKVRVTNNCTVRGYQQDRNDKTLDFKIKPGTGGTQSERYDIYAYHFIPKNAEEGGYRFTRRIDETYVTQSFGDIQSQPGGQIYIDGNVIVGGDMSAQAGDQIVKGRITVVATGNIWVADSIMADGPHDADGRPAMENPNVLGLIAQGIIKVVDPGMSAYQAGGIDVYPGPPAELTDFQYVPVGRSDGAGQYDRHLPDPMIVEAAITVGGGGWGAENVNRFYSKSYYGGRKEEPTSGFPDNLVVRGTITEAVRGVVGLIGQDGFTKQYYMDARLLEGILPGDVWLRGKYIPAPAGWHDYRATN